MVFQSESPICFFDVVKSGVSRNFQHIIVVSLSLWVVLLKESFLILIVKAVLIIKPLKCLGGILYRILAVQELIVVGSTISI